MSRLVVAIGGTTVPFVARASVRRDVLELGGSWQVTLDPATERLRALAREDAEIAIAIDGITVLRGFVGQRAATTARGGRSLTLQGRDRCGRLIDTVMPLGRLADLDLLELGRRCAGPWFSSIALSNTTNRALVRGYGPRALANREPVFSRVSEAQLRVQPGQSRAEVLRFFLAEAKLLAWSSADGRTLIIAAPNRSQAPQYRFDQRNVVSAQWTQTSEERGSEYIGYAQPVDESGEKYRIEETMRDPLRSFTTAKTVGLAIAADNRRQLRRRLGAEVAKRTMQARALELTVADYGQRYSPLVPKSLFAPDTVASVDLPHAGARGDFYITSVTNTASGRDAETTMQLLPVELEVMA